MPNGCAVLKCDGAFEATAHVMLDDGRRSDEWFLVPQCKFCNNHSRNGERMDLRVNAKLIRLADVREVDDRTARSVKEQCGGYESDDN